MTASVWNSVRRNFDASLRLRVLALTLAAFAIVAVPAAITFSWIVDRTVIKLGTLVAERQILYDRYRGLEALRREVALAETLMRSPTIIDWATDELDRDKYARGVAELEHFRRTFVDRSYFFVIDASGNYYFNDHNGAYTGAQRRYTISPDNPDDSWYYKTLAAGPGCHLNVNHDEVLGVTKVWMNCVVQEAGRNLGIVGTGIDLTHFLRNVVDTRQAGVESMFIDAAGAVQANRDESLIDFRSLTKQQADKKTLFQLLEGEEDRAALRSMMVEARSGEASTASQFIQINGRRALVGVGYLDELDWYNVTVMDVDQIIDKGLFVPIATLVALAMGAIAALMTLLFKRSVLDRLARAEETVRHIEAGDFTRPVRDDGADEIGRLAGALDRMARVVGADRATLEAAVRERTEQLEKIAYVDSLSGVLNRRGFIEAFDQQERRAQVDAPAPGLLILDIDNFKAVNDENGHAAGDEVIAEIARRLLDVTREQDLCARWGGDEFVVILKDCDLRALAAISAKILDGVRSRPIELPQDARLRVTTSIGACLIEAQDTLESATSKADAALYAAKRQGRNRVVIHNPDLHGDMQTVGRVA
ncbi:diguanylate cyclase [Mesorhizobium sp. CAU 1741]|uniref:GGDEF domain-containing protein n=1 Tax=Mesorhizobium sp. CAU 1741 TaxID=3140366 RepID=UPI00325B51F1